MSKEAYYDSYSVLLRFFSSRTPGGQILRLGAFLFIFWAVWKRVQKYLLDLRKVSLRELWAAGCKKRRWRWSSSGRKSAAWTLKMELSACRQEMVWNQKKATYGHRPQKSCMKADISIWCYERRAAFLRLFFHVLTLARDLLVMGHLWGNLDVCSLSSLQTFVIRGIHLTHIEKTRWKLPFFTHWNTF